MDHRPMNAAVLVALFLAMNSGRKLAPAPSLAYATLPWLA